VGKQFAVRTLLLFFIAVLMWGGLGQINPADQAVPARAEAPTSTPPVSSRRMSVPVNFTWYDWWLVRWENNEVTCRILVEHEGQPTQAEIRQACTQTRLNQWQASTPCNLNNPANCVGLYLHFVRSFPGKRNVDIYLPLPKVWISLVDCNPAPTFNRCTNMPALLLTGEEQLPNEQIIRVQGTFAGEPFSCEGDTCRVPLRPTGTQGVQLEFWGDSSFGDATEHYSALLRVTAQGDFMAPDGATSGDPAEWLVDVISAQWRDGTLTSCSDTWQVFPDLGGPPAWLNTPVNLDDMLTTRSYYYLAGKLITNGQVSAGTCPDQGLIAPQVANQCGLEKALPQVIDWQNRFDTEILKVAKDTGIPAQLMKNIFGRESQFWPGLYKDINEAGLGQLTDNGADTVLLWNPGFYEKFCPLILSKETCQNGYVFLKPQEKNMLRGGLLSQVNAACPTCPVGIDLTQADFSVHVFAESLQAFCSQTGRIITNVTTKSPGQVSTFVDLWKFTLANYNAGPGCLWDALSISFKAGERLTWANVSPHLDPVCQAAVGYVDAISGGQKLTPTPTAWVFAGTALPPPIFPTAPLYTPTPVRTSTPTLPGTPQPTPGGPTPTPTRTPTLSGPTLTPTLTPMPSATQVGYPAQPTPTPGGYPAQPTSPGGYP